MNEVEKHYATQPNHDAPHGGSGRADEDMASTATRAVKKATDAARDSVEQASGWARERYDETSSWAAQRYDSASRGATYARRRSVAELNRGRDSVGQFVEENPIMVGVAGLAAGLLLGALLPGTRRENELLGRYSDDLRDQGLRYANDLAEQGRHLVEETVVRPLKEGRADRDLGDETSAVR